jgi:hypothetical protein
MEAAMTYGTSVHADDEIACPVSDNLVARLMRADAGEVAKIALELPEAMRSRLAAFCYLRAHLREIGRELATFCAASSLIREAGPALGKCLIELQPEYVPQRPNTRPKVTLASAKDMISSRGEIDEETFEAA